MLAKKAVLFAAVFATPFSAGAVAHAEARIGQPAPDFNLPSALDAKEVGLKSLVANNKAVVVVFVATKCPFSNAYNERLAALARDYGPKGIALVGINANKSEPAAEVAKHARQHAWSFAVVKDEGSKVADLYGAQHTPEVFIVDAKGLLVYHGRIDDRHDDPSQVKSPNLRNALDALVAGTPIKVAETKAFGCSIKR